MFTITQEPQRLLHVVRTGVWTQEEAARYRAAMRPALAGGDPATAPALLLIDLTAAATIPKDAMDEMAQTAQAIGRSAIRRVAVAGTSAVSRLQAKRLLAGLVDYAAFDTAAEARAWLLSPPERGKRG